MTWNMDDPRWTAYVLGELDDADRAELDRVLAERADARGYVDSLRETIGAIESELQALPAPALDDLQRRRIAKAAVAPRVRRWPLWTVGGIAAAGAALLMFASTQHNDATGPRIDDYKLQVDLDKQVELDNKNDHAEVTARLVEKNAEVQQKYGLTAMAPQGQPAFSHGRWNGLTMDVANGHNTEAYSRIDDNPYYRTAKDPLSTFSIDVDTASYSNLRRFLEGGQRPPKDAVRIEEMINYFKYAYPQPQGNEPFSITTEVGPSPWNAKHQLVRVGLRTAEIQASQVPARNLVFLIDVSGSMQPANKLPLLRQSLGLLVETLRSEDKVSMVVYAGAAGLVLPPTSGNEKQTILDALGKLEAGGSTAGAEGIQLAYQTAAKTFIKHGINRVILCSDGDYNVGITDEGELTRLIERERQRGVFLTVLGFGMGNLKDSMMEKLADRGNGNYAYIDSLFEARKVLVKEAGATLVTVAKDVKLQVEFNPTTVAGYRLIGYENRVMANQDFNDDKKDAGEIGAGHTVTALYEIVPAGVAVPSTKTDDLKYQTKTVPAGTSTDLFTVKVRYKAPTGDTSKLLSRAVTSEQRAIADTSVDFRWAAAVAGFGMLLRESPHRGTLSWQQVQSLAEGAIGADAEGYRRQALSLITKASKLPAQP